MLTVRMYVPTLANCICSRRLPIAPRYPPAPITGPGERLGTAKAASVVTPSKESSHPPARSHGWLTSPPRQQHRIEHGQRNQQVVGAEPKRFEQQPAADRPRVAAHVHRLGVRRERRVCWADRPDRNSTAPPREKPPRQQSQCQQVEFQIAMFEHKCGYSS